MNTKLTPQDIKRYNGYIWKFFIGCFAFLVIMIVATMLGAFKPLPTLSDLEHPKSDQSTIIYSSDKQVLGKWYWRQNRSSVTYKNISPNVIHALVAKEDNHFYSHSGIDFWRTFTIIPYNLIGKTQGASTLTQQLAKNQFTDTPSHNPVKRVIQKLKELIIAIRIEKHYTKEEIITMYLNTVDFGSNSFGIASAAQTYFNTTPAKLTPDQAATLVQILTSTTKNSPVRHPKTAQRNRDFVLKRMADEGYLSESDANMYKAKPLVINYHTTNHAEGLAPYFRKELKDQVTNILKGQGVFKPDGTEYNVDRDGLRIYTTIDSRMQQYAEDAQKEYMRDLQKQFNSQYKGVNLAKTIKNYDLLMRRGIAASGRYKDLKIAGKSDDEIKEIFNTKDTLTLFTWHGDVDTAMRPIDSVLYSQMLLRNAMMSMDPATGYIKAWVGGINFENYQYDQVIKGVRQVGSTAKTFTYTVAINQGYSPCLEVPNVPITFPDYPGKDGKPWVPASSQTETIAGMVDLKTALAYSQNWIVAYMMNEVHPEPVAEMIKKLGITSPVPPYPSICLGSFEATVYDMTGAYSVYANHGQWTQPIYLLRIEDKNGHVLYNNVPNVKPVISEQTAYVMTDMLKSVIDKTAATGNRLRWRYHFTNPIAGKTGTTSDNSDGWFMGMVPQLVTGVWTGCENRDFHFRTTMMGEGSNSALPIFAGYMKRIYADPALGIKKDADFELPKKPLDVVIDCAVYGQQQKTAAPAIANPAAKKITF
jgi:penicillin-binding protein 1A